MSEDTEIKICGLSTPETVDAAVDAGATHIGLNLYEPSPRYVTVEQAVKLRRRVPPSVKVALVVVNMEAEPTARVLDAVRPDIIQFHGLETPEWLALIKNNTPLEVWKAWGVRNADSLANALKYKDAVHRMLYDAPAQKMPGGTGTAIDWSIMEGFRHQIPWGLAGGLSPQNVAEAIARTGAPLVDASSGLETAPGVKDVDLIRQFCKAAREA
ncbi:phosphoribosylanthranilate isomerase [Altererythrobacter salegens]|uniref:N-(5'-phosphoribosyl)anthranilate isomerase n=1 Tax=Croceibacterium salegens TaxID=1737568 RepID=A0A6I4SWJ7_9SPHN|nr:phosphoribosylanthranilate isomerase [Croceibacterium salegens]MXO59166.1 phosphoribosylanthranilate isomerase [Croceibacterium salegens]